MEQLINDGWSFVKLAAGSTLQDAEKAGFTPVDLPHDWLIWQEDLYETADAWYRRSLFLRDAEASCVLIRFDGVYMDCDVLLNGEVVCSHPYGYTAFDADLSGKLKKGENLLTVHIRHQSPNSRWYSGSGIFRDVFLITLPKEHLIPDSIYVHEKEENSQWLLFVSAETAGTRASTPCACSLYDRKGNLCAEAPGTGTGGTVQACLSVPDARLWSPDDPYLYTLQLQYGQQKVSRKIGLRSVFADPDHGFFLNGQPLKLRGVCLHHDLGALGAAFHPKAARRQLALMRKMGANAVRTSHNPPASAFLDLCDEMGILVIDEAFDMWERAKTEYDYARFFPAHYREDVASWIRRDRCHPCVVMWSIGNEIYDMHADLRGTEVTRLLTEEVRHHDPLRHALVTFGCNYMAWEGGQRCAEAVDAVGYNYGEKLYETHHQLNPSWVIYGSETASILSSRGIYHFPLRQSIMSEEDRQCSALGNSNTSWGAENLQKILMDDLRTPYSLGQFIWSGIDYIGEPTPYHTRSCYFGQADTACFPKDPFYLFQSFWTKGKMIHLGVTWDWNRGQMIDVPVMTNCPEAELFLNGESLGRTRRDPDDPDRALPVWRIPFTPGILTAKGYDGDGRLLCEDTRVTPGETDHFSLLSEDEYLLSDGWDLAFVTVTAEDAEHHPVENARDRLSVSVSGGGRLVGTDNGDSTDTDSYKSDCRRLFSGRLLLMIGSNGRQEDVIIRVRGSRLPEAELRLPVEPAALRPGTSCLMNPLHQTLPEETEARRVDILPLDTVQLTPDHPEAAFRFTVHPASAEGTEITWEVTNAAGIQSPVIQLRTEDDCVYVRAFGDGCFYLRALCGKNGQCDLISQLEIGAAGFGNPAMNPYDYVSAGLYDLHEGEIGTGNEKGIAFARGEYSMAGFRAVDFGKAGSDRLTADIFALNGDPHDIELWAGKPDGEKTLIDILRYEKPSIWNVYQKETWKLPVRLTGLQTLCFALRDKVHMKGFVFERQSAAYLPHAAAHAEVLYGDQFRREGDAILGIGNNVTLTWTDLDFGGDREALLRITGHTSLAKCTVNLRVRNDAGEECLSVPDFIGGGETTQVFRVPVPGGNCSVSFVFLPGSDFDFRSFVFERILRGSRV